MTMPSFPIQGQPNNGVGVPWTPWAEAVHDAVTEVVEGRLTEEALRAAFEALDSEIKSDLRTLVCFGDSITEGNNYGHGYSYPGNLATALASSATVVNLGKSGWTSTEVAIRQGGRQVTLGAFSLPAGTSAVQVSVTSPTAAFRTNAEIFPAWVGVLTFGATSIPGTLKHTIDSGAATPNAWTFQRTTAGSAVSVPAGAVFTATEFAGYLGATAIIGVGRNNIDDPALVAADVAAMVAKLTPELKRFLVLSVTTTTTETSGTAGYNKVAAINALLAATYGNRFVDTRRYLIDQGLAYNGMSPTSADSTAIAGDTIPPSLIVTQDVTHPNGYGYRAMAACILDKLTALDWLKQKPAAIPAPTATPAYAWDANTLTGADGAAVSSWAPSAGALSLTQGTAGKQPTIVTAGGRKWVRLDGVDDELAVAALGLAQPFTVLARVTLRSLATQPGLQGILWPATGSAASMMVKTNGQVQVAANGVVVQTTPGSAASDASTILVGVYNGASTNVRVNTGTPVTGTLDPTYGMSQAFRIGYAFDSAGRLAAMDLAELRIYTKALDSSEIASAVAAMNAA